MSLTKFAFYHKFNTLRSETRATHKALERAQDVVENLEKRLENQEFAREVLDGIKSTPRMNDPGKYQTAFYFAEKIGKTDIKGTGEPTLYHPCPSCKEKLPVILSYAQTDDSPEGDTWTKKAFIICPDGTYKELASFYRSDRF